MIEWHTMSCRTISLLLVLLVIVLGQETATTSLAQQPRLQKELGDCGARFASCSASDPQARRPICGSDNQTYPGRCHLLRAQCQGVRVSVKHRGRCKASPCLALVRRPLLFEPTCLEDGSFAPVQCHVETGYCWCVTPAGKPIPNSSVRNARPNCNRRGRRRSSARGRKQKKVGVVGCGREDRTAFNKNLLNIFDAEYSRQMAANNGEEMDERALLDWKFTEMDLDGDGFLVRAEYRDLRRLVKKMVKPKRCAKTFTRLCDLDHDQRVSRDEWAACLRLDFNHESQEEDGEQKTEDAVLQGSVPSLPGISGSDESSEGNDEPEAIDCLSDRKAVLDEQKAGNSEFYVPECTPDGRYQKIQCYKSTGYCWCVHEDNGKPIPGTSIKDQAPKCDSVPAPSRPMHGCPEPRKQAFLRELLDFMTKKMMAAANNTDIDRSIPLKETWQSPEEHVATWNFMMLDKNKNKVLERKEWKNFRVLVSGKPQLCRCGKRLPRYCDVNHDRKISITEWLNCLDAQRANSLTVNPTSASRRKGLNPLEIYLKEDD